MPSRARVCCPVLGCPCVGDQAAVDDVCVDWLVDNADAVHDFMVVELDPGEERQVEFQLEHDRLGYYGPDNTYRTDPGTFAVWIAPYAASGEPTMFTLPSPQGTMAPNAQPA